MNRLCLVLSRNAQKLRNTSAFKLQSCNFSTIIEKVQVGEGEVTVAEQKKTTRPPFVKNLFLGHFDYEILTYPEVLDKERLKSLEEMVQNLEKLFSEKVDSKQIDMSAKIPEDTLKALQDMGLFGQMVPTEYGGLGLSATEYARIAEVISRDGSIAITLTAHQAIGYKGVLIAGSDEQKKKYLPKLVSGEWIAAFCLTETISGSDAASLESRAKLSENGKTWILNGSKIWITNGGWANFFTVFATTEVEDTLGNKEDKITAFLVERDFGGVTHGKPEDKLGIRGSNTCEIRFDNTPIPIENVLGEVGEGFKVAMNILNSGRFSMGNLGAGVLKWLIQIAVEHVVNRKQFGKQLKDFELIQEKLAKMACTIYAIESMTYLTAGLLDSVENPDCSVEAAVVKVFSSEACWSGCSEILQIFGGVGYMKNYPIERCLRDSRILMIFEETNEILRLFISLMGIQHAANELREIIKKLRNPLMNPGFVFGKLWERRKQIQDDPDLNLGLDGYLHPTLKGSSDQLEYSVLRLKFVVELVLERNGRNIVDYQMELKRLADIVIDVYAMTAVLGRASRSYCIGLSNVDEELLLAKTFCNDAYNRVKSNVHELAMGPINTNDRNYKMIAEKIFSIGGYFAEHALTRNF